MRNLKRKRIVSAFCAITMLFSATGNWALPLQSIAEEETETGCTEQETAAGTEAETETETDSDLCCKSFALYPNGENAEQAVSLEGMMPEGASAEVVNVSGAFPGVVAYDITITDGKEEFQPTAEAPILVEIADPGIYDEDHIEVWHMLDNGDHEVITDFALEDGKISFYAAGFSVYAVVAEADVVADNDPGYNWRQDAAVNNLAKLSEQYGGFYINQNNFYFTNEQVTIPNSERTGIQNTSKSADAVPSNAIPYYFEKVAGTNNQYYVYCYQDNENKTGKLYVMNEGTNSLSLTDSEDQKTAFVVSVKNANLNTFQVKSASSGYYWNIANNNTITTADTKSKDFVFWYYVPPKEDSYKLDGVEHTLLHYTGGTIADALMADPSANAEGMMCVSVRNASSSTTLYITEDADATVWKFHNTELDQYKISAEVGGETRYLKAEGNSLVLSDADSATVFKVIPGAGGTIKLTDGDKTVYYDGATKSFQVGTPTTPASQWLSFAEQSALLPTDYVSYSAEKVSISSVQNGEQVIVYTRIWNDTKKIYEFYAIDHDGTMYPCYERGNDIMWMGGQINTLLWDFTEYYNTDGTINNYYELYNPYSKKYIAPQIKANQVLSDKTLGLNMPGRRNGDFYTTFLAWDNPQYAYASLKVENGQLVPATRADAATFYFAKVENNIPFLTKVETIDNDLYGIKMKMVDFKDRAYQLSYIGSDNYDNTIQQGLLSTDLDENGYPVAVNAVNNVHHSLSEMYATAKDVNHLFIKSTYEASGYFEFDSCQNFATLMDSNNDGNFTVYKELGTSDLIDRPTLKHGQFLPYNTISDGIFATENNPLNLYSALAIYNDKTAGKLSEDDPRKYERLYSVGPDPNYYNGMEVSAKFVQTWNGCDDWGHDMIFEFTGDDDFWLYVDGELVIDLGGVHSALAGNINFRTGEVVVNGNKTNLRDVFESNYKKRFPNATATEIHDFLANYFDEVDGTFTTVFKNYSNHTMRIFYMERGASASNLHMRFNLSYASEDHVTLTKQVTGTNDMEFDRVEYPYQIFFRDNLEDPIGERMSPKTIDGEVLYENSIQTVGFKESYTPTGSKVEFPDVYFVYPHKRVELHFPETAKQYRIVECGVDSLVYDSVKVNDKEITGTPIEGSSHKLYDSGWLDVNEVRNINYENHVGDEGLLTLSIQKVLYDEGHQILTSAQDPTKFRFRLSLSNGVTDDLYPVYYARYCLKNEAGNLVVWDADAQAFVEYLDPSDPETYTDFNKIPDAKKESYSFYSSPNGAIDNIPAGYSVEVPNLPIGTKFLVEERERDIPVGYRLIGYERVNGSYVEDETVNCGWIRASEHPKMLVKNQRGCEIEVEKIWTDEKFMEVYDTIYTAVYLDGKMIDGTVKEIEYPENTVRYYFDSLEPNRSLEEYEVYEVVPKADGTGYTKANENDRIVVKARSKYTPEEIQGLSDYNYRVNYDRGEVETTAPSDNVNGLRNIRKDTITNTRTDGIVLTLYDMADNLPLADGEFVLMQGETVIDTYTSDSTGRITILYDFKEDTDYTLIETAPPAGYIGLPHPSVFNVSKDEDAITITVTGNEDPTLPTGKVWEKAYPSNNPGDVIVAYVDVFNKKFNFSAVKVARENTEKHLSGAHFALYRQTDGILGTIKDVAPIPGYEDLVTESDGVIPMIDNTLPAGTYYLTETKAPKTYDLIEGDVVFTIAPLGGVTLEQAPEGVTLEATNTDEATFVLVVSDKKHEHIVLTGIAGTQGSALLLIVLPLIPIAVVLIGRRKKKHADNSDAA
ncbi:MAG: hypothetical protein K5695_10690 [Oscillospiraceae bacterium]|nr:hypothetical protein [Oscillospiraceae bacterium]